MGKNGCFHPFFKGVFRIGPFKRAKEKNAIGDGRQSIIFE